MKINNDIIIKQFINKHGNKYDYSLVEYKGTHIKVKIICTEHGIFEQSPNHHKKGSNCSKCVIEKNRYSKEQVIKQFINKHGNKYDYSLVEYINDSSIIKIICHIHGIFEQRVNNHKNGQGCPKCKKIDLTDFITKANIIHNNFYIYDKTIYKSINKKIVITCPIHGDFEQIAHNHITLKQKCHRCKIDNMKLTTEQFIEKANTIHNYKYNYSITNYKSNKDKVEIICSTHGRFIQKANNHLNGKGCTKCKESKGEALIRKYLDDNNIIYEKEKTFKDCVYNSYLKFDFYLPNHNICIEYDGEHHFIPIDFFGGENSLIETQKRDMLKNQYCKEKNIKMLRISYKQKNNIKNILYNNV